MNGSFPNYEFLLLDLGVPHTDRQVSSVWAGIPNLQILDGDSDFSVEIVHGAGGYWVTLSNDPVPGAHGKIVLFGEREL